MAFLDSKCSFPLIKDARNNWGDSKSISGGVLQYITAPTWLCILPLFNCGAPNTRTLQYLIVDCYSVFVLTDRCRQLQTCCCEQPPEHPTPPDPHSLSLKSLKPGSTVENGKQNTLDETTSLSLIRTPLTLNNHQLRKCDCC